MPSHPITNGINRVKYALQNGTNDFKFNHGAAKRRPEKVKKVDFFQKSIFLTSFYKFPHHGVFIKVVTRKKWDDFDTSMRRF